ncbi:MAG: hypothetical protein NC489_34650, partial [Ruminococcus flavefaciens]|nr:hypothetical protein [Ruminococcus flavefaciens]
MKRGKENDGKSSRKAERRVSSSSKGRQQATVADSKSDDAKSERKQQPVAVQKSSRNSKHQKVDSAKETAVATELKAKHREKVKKERFLRERMWFSTIISKFFMDRGTIPDNIGNNVLVTNNVYITKNHITALFFITEMSEVTPMCWMSDMVEYVKDQAEGVVVDIS